MKLRDNDCSSVIRSFPPLLTHEVDDQLQPAYYYMCRDIGITQQEVAKMIRAFPAILTVDVETGMKPVVDYFREVGVRNVGRVVCRLPPVLGYAVDSNLAPKMEYLLKDLRLSMIHILMFPGLFSYSLEERIKPRTWFLCLLRLPISDIGLSSAISLTDEDFCMRVAHVPVRFYEAYCRDLGIVGNRKVSQENRQSGRQQAGRRNVEADAAIVHKVEEETIWGKKQFRTSLERIPWRKLDGSKSPG